MTDVDLQWLRELAQKLCTQDSAMTADPIWTVQEEKTVYGFDVEYADEHVWCRDDGDYTEACERQSEMRKLREQLIAIDAKLNGGAA